MESAIVRRTAPRWEGTFEPKQFLCYRVLESVFRAVAAGVAAQELLDSGVGEGAVVVLPCSLWLPAPSNVPTPKHVNGLIAHRAIWSAGRNVVIVSDDTTLTWRATWGKTEVATGELTIKVADVVDFAQPEDTPDLPIPDQVQIPYTGAATNRVILQRLVEAGAAARSTIIRELVDRRWAEEAAAGVCQKIDYRYGYVGRRWAGRRPLGLSGRKDVGDSLFTHLEFDALVSCLETGEGRAVYHGSGGGSGTLDTQVTLFSIGERPGSEFVHVVRGALCRDARKSALKLIGDTRHGPQLQDHLRANPGLTDEELRERFQRSTGRRVTAHQIAKTRAVEPAPVILAVEDIDETRHDLITASTSEPDLVAYADAIGFEADAWTVNLFSDPDRLSSAARRCRSNVIDGSRDAAVLALYEFGAETLDRLANDPISVITDRQLQLVRDFKALRNAAVTLHLQGVGGSFDAVCLAMCRLRQIELAVLRTPGGVERWWRRLRASRSDMRAATQARTSLDGLLIQRIEPTKLTVLTQPRSRSLRAIA